jgi:serine/threonine protein kinase
MAKQFLRLNKALENIHNVVDSESHGGRHGDIKPSSILLVQPRGVKKPHLALTDFGLGKHRKVSRSRQDPEELGRIATYRPPEFDLHGGLVGPRSNVYSLGCVFLEYIA